MINGIGGLDKTKNMFKNIEKYKTFKAIGFNFKAIGFNLKNNIYSKCEGTSDNYLVLKINVFV